MHSEKHGTITQAVTQGCVIPSSPPTQEPAPPFRFLLSFQQSLCLPAHVGIALVRSFCLPAGGRLLWSWGVTGPSCSDEFGYFRPVPSRLVHAMGSLRSSPHFLVEEMEAQRGARTQRRPPSPVFYSSQAPVIRRVFRGVIVSALCPFPRN